MIALVPTEDIGKLKVDQTARIRIVGAGEVDGKVTRIAPTVPAQQPARPGYDLDQFQTRACW